jgi:hypothetical protein
VPGTLQALGVFLLALLPGAIYIWSFERVVGRWGIGLSDRVLRFTACVRESTRFPHRSKRGITGSADLPAQNY